jgi:hypothetical protein
MKMNGVSAALLATAFAVVGPATVLAGSPTGGVPVSPERLYRRRRCER